jgi:hypothetical protein
VLTVNAAEGHRTQAAVADRQRLGLPILRRLAIPKRVFGGVDCGNRQKRNKDVLCDHLQMEWPLDEEALEVDAVPAPGAAGLLRGFVVAAAVE